MANGKFGSSCSVDGDTIVVGATGEDVAYVYSRAGNWSLQQVLQAASGGDELGAGARVLGDSVAIGASPLSGPGSIVIFDRVGTAWTQRQRIQPNNGSGGRDGIGLHGSFGFSPQWLLPGALEPSGTYFLRLTAANAAGVSTPSNEVTLVVP